MGFNPIVEALYPYSYFKVEFLLFIYYLKLSYLSFFNPIVNLSEIKSIASKVF